MTTAPEMEADMTSNVVPVLADPIDRLHRLGTITVDS